MSDVTDTATLNRSERKRRAILAAGHELFLQQGYHGTTVDQIAAQAQVSKQTVYKQFGEKEELLFAIVSAVLDQAAAPVLGRIAALTNTTDLEGDLTELAVEYLHTVLAEPVTQLRRLVIAEAGRLPRLAEMYYRRAPATTLEALAETFGRLHDRGLLRSIDPSMAADHFAFLVVGRPIDQALFFGGTRAKAEIDPAGYARHAVAVFLAAYRPSDS
jgi:TetR/AcrR family transcriptional regulator, mexJK operon transcriptional repressor